MSRTAQGVVLAAVTAGFLVMLFAWPAGAASAQKPDKCLSIGLPVTGPGAGVSTVGCIPLGPKPPPPPPPTTPPPPPPSSPPTPPPPPPTPAPPVITPQPAVVVAPIPTTVPTTTPTTQPTTPPPRPTTPPTPVAVAAPLPPPSITAEVAKQRRWGLTALVLLVGGGAAASRIRASRTR